MLLGELDDFAEQPVAAVHRRRRSQHDSRVSTSLTEMCQDGKHFFVPRLRRGLCSSASSLCWLSCETDRILIAQRGNEHSPDAGLLEGAKNSIHFIYGEPGPGRKMIDNRRHSVLDHFAASQLGGCSYLCGRQMREILCRRS